MIHIERFLIGLLMFPCIVVFILALAGFAIIAIPFALLFFAVIEPIYNLGKDVLPDPKPKSLPDQLEFKL